MLKATNFLQNNRAIDAADRWLRRNWIELVDEDTTQEDLTERAGQEFGLNPEEARRVVEVVWKEMSNVDNQDLL